MVYCVAIKIKTIIKIVAAWEMLKTKRIQKYIYSEIISIKFYQQKDQGLKGIHKISK